MKFFDRAIHIFLIGAIILVMLEVMTEVVSRYIFHSPLPWGAEFSQTLLVWITFVGSAAAFLRGEHIGVEMLFESLPRLVRKVVFKLNVIIIMTFLGFGVWSGYKVVTRVWEDITASLQISAGIMYLALPVGFCLMLIFGVWMLFTGNEKYSVAEHAKAEGN